mmetsp:Transcript_33003/g.56472  ORF Transcript_33003/g.56472 Transcript_33003/m.56472 type:complete len:129 (-) Transcript_33003:274-660(-)
MAVHPPTTPCKRTLRIQFLAGPFRRCHSTAGAEYSLSYSPSRPLPVPTKKRSLSPEPAPTSPIEEEAAARQFAQSSWSMFRRLESAGVVGGDSNPATLEHEDELRNIYEESDRLARVLSSTDLFSLEL